MNISISSLKKPTLEEELEKFEKTYSNFSLVQKGKLSAAAFMYKIMPSKYESLFLRLSPLNCRSELSINQKRIIAYTYLLKNSSENKKLNHIRMYQEFNILSQVYKTCGLDKTTK